MRLSSSGDVSMKLSSCLALLPNGDGVVEPFYCDHTDGFALFGTNANGSSGERNVRGLEIPPQTMRLGFMNTATSGPYLVQRMSTSQTKIGLSSRNSRTTRFDTMSVNNLNPSRLVSTEGFHKMLRNEYPTLNEAYESAKSIAISRNLVLKPVSYLSRQIYNENFDPIGEFSSPTECIIYKGFGFYKDVILKLSRTQGVEINVRVTT